MNDNVIDITNRINSSNKNTEEKNKIPVEEKYLKKIFELIYRKDDRIDQSNIVLDQIKKIYVDDMMKNNYEPLDFSNAEIGFMYELFKVTYMDSAGFEIK